MGARTFLLLFGVALGACGLVVRGTQSGAGEGDGGPEGADAASADGSSDGSADAVSDGGAGDAQGDCGADLSSDPSHCGACFHDCLGGACSSGACQPVAIVTGATGVYGLAIDGDNLYFTRQSAQTVSTCLVDGGSASVVVADAGPAAHVAVAGGDLYWTVYRASVGLVYARTLADGATRVVAAGQNYPCGVTVVGTAVYWALQYDDSMAMSLGDGGSTVVTAGGLDFPEGLTHDGAQIYVAAPGGQVFAVGFGGTPKTELVTGLATDWPAGVAEDGDTLYFTLRNSGKVVSMKKTGGAITTLAAGQSTPVGIVIDARALYWANSGAGTIMRLAR